MKTIKGLAAAALMMVAAPASAEDWWFLGFVGKPAERIVYFADADVNAVDGYQHLWVERVLERSGARGETTVKSLFIFDCNQRRFSEMQQLLFDSAGEQIARPRVLPEWTFVPPSSMGATLMRFACQTERPSGGRIGDHNTRTVAAERVFKLQPR